MIRDRCESLSSGQGGSIRLHKAWRKIIILAALGKHSGTSLASSGMEIPQHGSCGLCNWHELVAKVEKGIIQVVDHFVH